MPSTSAKQHRAMEAAAHGHSTLGIPAKVGKEFVAADKAKGSKSMRKIAKVKTVTTKDITSKRATAALPAKSSAPTTPAAVKDPAGNGARATFVKGPGVPMARRPKADPSPMPGEEDLARMHTSKHH